MATAVLPGISARCSVSARGQICGAGPICLVTRRRPRFKLFITYFRGDVINDAEGAGEGRYGCTVGPIWVHGRADMGSRKGRY